MSVEHFIDTIRSTTGGAPPYEDVVPGKRIRFATSDRRGDDAGWCMLFEDGEAGAFGCWRQGISDTWQARPARSSEEHAAFLGRVKQAKEAAAAQELQLRATCRKKSSQLWDKGSDADVKHPYLAAKEIRPFGIRQLQDSLLVPVRDIHGVLHGLQFILPDGKKRFLKGTAVAGCYHAIAR